MPSSSSFKRLATFLLALPLTAFAGLNDWSKPCTNGECYYDLPAKNGGASGTIKIISFFIWGSPDAISDITEAAGWSILGCDPTAQKQDIRLVCTSPTGCNQLYAKTGAVNKVVRLPENCGASAFARISQEGVSPDQSIPPEVAKKFAGQRGTAVPSVKGMTFDTNFAAIDPNVSGKVYISVVGTTLPVKDNTTLPLPSLPAARRGEGLSKRSWWDDWNTFDESGSIDLPPVDINHDWPLFSQTLSCSGFNAAINADVQFSGHAQLALGAAASGTFIPPNFDYIGVFLGVYTATLDGKVILKGNAAGLGDTGAVTLYQTGLPGLDFAGIFSVTPTFKILADASYSLNLNADLTLDLSYNIQNAQLYYPPNGAPASGGSFTPGSSVHLAADPTLSTSANVDAYVMPRVEVNIDALSVASADVFLDLKARAYAGMTVDPSSSGTPYGCADAHFQLHADAGADADFFGLFNPSTSVTLYDQTWLLFSECFGSASRRELADTVTVPIHQLERRWTCPATPPSGTKVTIL